MTEEIGKVKLDYSKYSGEDLYCDGAVEDELLKIVKEMSPVEYAGVIEERKSWPILYHLSSLRENIVDWIPIGPEDKVLEVGSGCGAITGVLATKAGSVTCVDLSKKRSLINAHRHSECGNITIHVGNFKDIEPELPNDFTYICLIGVFEYGQSYIGGENAYEDFLNLLKPHMAEGGRIVIAIENKYGMKYFAGCKEDHLGTFFSSIENYAEGGGVRTFSRQGLERIFHTCGLDDVQFYYPYPDYKFMTTLYSDRHLPGKGELSNNLRNFDRDRMLLFDEKNAFDGVTEEGLFPVFANSYVAVLGKPFEVEYVRYSNDRASEYQIKTVIFRKDGDELKNRVVRKYPLTSDAEEHVKGMEAAYENLVKRYEGSRLEINRCNLSTEEGQVYAEFEFVPGRPLTELMDSCLERGDQEGFRKLFREYVEHIGSNSEFPVADFDLVFSNILVDGDKWTLIDYEWTFGKPIETKELAFRAVYCYLLESEKRGSLELDWILEELGVSADEAENYREQEREFQRFVTGKHHAMAEIRDMIGYRVMTPQKWIDRYQDSERINRVQVYEDRGQGCSEANSYFVQDAYQGDGIIELELDVSSDVKLLRVDPAFDCCVVKILELTFNGERIPLEKRKVLTANGKIANGITVKSAEGHKRSSCPSIVFPTEDPNINISLVQMTKQPVNKLYLKMEITRLPLGMAQDIAAAIKERKL